MSDNVDKINYEHDYGLRILAPTSCKTGTHIWLTTGSSPKAGDRCTCGRHIWPDGETAA